VSDAGLAYLLERAGLVEERIRALVADRRADDPNPDDPFRGLYLSNEIVDRLLESPLPQPPPSSTSPAHRPLGRAGGTGPTSTVPTSRLQLLASAAGLTELDTDFLMIALVPDLDSRFERLYGYLNDDVTRRRATIGLALELAGESPASATARARLAAGSPLVDRGLILIEDLDRPFLTRGLRLPDRLIGHLLGADAVDPELSGVLADATALDAEPAAGIARALRSGVHLVHLRERVAGTGSAVALAALDRIGFASVCLDLNRLASESDPSTLVDVAGREALLRGGGVVAAPVEALADANPSALRRLAGLPLPVLLSGVRSWDPAWSDVVPLLAEPAAPTSVERAAMWQRELAGDLAGLDLGATDHFVLGPGQVVRAVRAAQASALLDDSPPTSAHLRGGARAQNAAGLERLARRVEPDVGWADLVLPTSVIKALHDLAGRAQHRDLVLTEWRMRPGGGRGRGITALFAGDSGTGKTMSAEVIAAELGLDLYTVNLATVIDKYIGETEKNLERIFTEASGVNAVLLFDEADAIFGKRSEVRDAHDRYANIESAYLLQRMETFDGLAILATNLRSNIDEAFTRRLDSIIDFPPPTEHLRFELWRRCLAPPVPCAPDVDLAFCARAFTLSGGNIRSVAITAAYRAAEAGRPITMSDLIVAIQLEYRKLGRLVLEQEFGAYLSELS
jgi:hypothetical protein